MINDRFGIRVATLQVWMFALAAGSDQAVAGEPLVPLTELGTAKYRGEESGLYGSGRNEPPAALLKRANKAVAKIEPLDREGKPTAGGKIVLLSIGMSNTAQEFSAFAQLVRQDRRKRPDLVLVDGARGGADAAVWAGGDRRERSTKGDPWRGVEQRLEAAGVTRDQVQVAWIKHALARPARYGEFPAHVEALEEALAKIVRTAHEQYPNLRIAFLSSRSYGGYATTGLNPEPFAYESAFAVRGLIARQTKRDKAEAPVLLWGPYLWADGRTPRRADGLVWRREDFRDDGTHPSEQGLRKVAEQMLEFFTRDELGKEVFCGRQ